MPPLLIRDAIPADLTAILDIHNDVVATTTAIYSEEATTLAERENWFAGKAAAGFPVIVGTIGSDVVGFATFGTFRAWPCYRNTIEHSVHVCADQRGNGFGRALLQAIIERASDLRYHVIVAGIDAENEASIALHESVGFLRVGTLPQVGRKFDRWLDLVFMHQRLSEA